MAIKMRRIIMDTKHSPGSPKRSSPLLRWSTLAAITALLTMITVSAKAEESGITPAKANQKSTTDAAPAAYVNPLVDAFPMHSVHADADYFIQVGLPWTYRKNVDQRYPVLFVMDAPVFFGGALDIVRTESIGTALLPSASKVSALMTMPEMIVVGVGFPVPGDDPLEAVSEWGIRRAYEFSYEDELSETRREMDTRTKAIEQDLGRSVRTGGAPRFLDFIVKELYPKIDSSYRTAPAPRVFFGHSGGGRFGMYTLFTRPEAFTHYIIGSAGMGDSVERLESAYASSHQDLATSVFVGLGGAELEEPYGQVPAMAQFIYVLSQRGYPSLRFSSWVFPDESHISVALPTLSKGLNRLLGDD